MNSDLYDMIFKRKSFHLFRNIGDERITEDELKVAEDEVQKITDSMVEEIDNELKQLGDKRRNEYYIFDIKEKYGELRWYDVGGTKEIDDIIDKYSTISHHVCIGCGKPDVPLLTRIGWVMPLCKECYNNRIYHGVKYEDAYDHSLSSKINNEYTKLKFVPYGKNERIKYDISETVNVVRNNYKARYDYE